MLIDEASKSHIFFLELIKELEIHQKSLTARSMISGSGQTLYVQTRERQVG